MFFKLTNTLKLNYISKKKKLKINLNKKDKQLLNIFIKLNVIKLVKHEKNKFVIYFQYINNEPILKNIQNMYKPSKPTFINLKQIKKINKNNNSIFYISSSKGVVNNFEAEKLKIGGLMILTVKI